MRLNASTIKEGIDPLNFYTREQNIHRFPRATQGVLAGLCPFHEDTKVGSFKVNLARGAFRCWSCGASGGDVIAFTQKKYELKFFDAMQKLSSDWGLS